MSKRNLTNKQKKLLSSILVIAIVLVLTLVSGKDIKQAFHSIFPDVISTELTEPTIPTGEVNITPEPESLGSVTDNTPEGDSSAATMVQEDGIYTTPDLVAAYIHTFHKLPSNFITKNEAAKLGWDSGEGNLWDVTDEMSIGGDRFGNYEKLLPEADGRIWYECDVNYSGGYRGSERIVYSNDGLIYYTDDHYESFTQLY